MSKSNPFEPSDAEVLFGFVFVVVALAWLIVVTLAVVGTHFRTAKIERLLEATAEELPR